MRIKATLFLMFALLAAAHAQLKVSLHFDSAAPREVFVAKAVPEAPPDNAIKSTGAGIDYPLPAFADGDRIYVWDRSSNNLASIAIKDIKAGSWSPKTSDYTIVGLVTVRVEHKGEGVQAAKVTLSTKGKTQEKLLDPTGEGNVEFFGFPTGDFHVKVGYNTVDKKQSSVEQIYPVGIKRDKAEPVLTVAISDDVATVAASAGGTPAASGQSSPGSAQKKADGEAVAEGSPFGKIVMILVTLVIIAGAAYWFLQTVKKDPKVFEDNLKKLGVQVPNQQDPSASAPTPVTPLPPAGPPPQILLDDSSPTPLGAAASPVAAVAATPLGSSEPTLVKESGERFELTEGESLVGREDGLPVSLAGESTVSRRHASLTRTGGTAVLKDLGSTNGTFVNGTRLQGETTLRPGDQVQFGSVRFRYEGS